jgi:hypothetical protein
MVLIKEGKQNKNLNESFRPGQAGKVIGLFIKVLSKRIHKQLMVSPYPYDYQTTEGKFSSYYAMFPNGKQALRINFKLTDSDIIHSVDFFSKPDRLPDLKIYLDGLNIIQILKTVEDAIAGHVESFGESVVQEANKPEDSELEQWFTLNLSNYNSQKLKITELNQDYLSWCYNNSKIPAKSSYRKLKALVKSLAIRDPNFVPTEISLGRVENSVPIDRPLVDSSEVSAFSAIQNEADDHLKKYEMLAHYLKIISAKDQPHVVNGLVAYGKSGIGKTASIGPILKSLGTKFVSYTGTVGGPTALYQLLWKHSSSDIVDVILFDDCDTILKTEVGINLLKGAMDDKEERWIDYVTRRSESVLNETDDLEPDGPATLADFGATVDSTTQIAPSKAPDRFLVLPKIIFISNLKEFPAPIISRCLSVKFQFTEDQVWDLIINNTENLIDPTRRAQQWSTIQGIEFRPLTREAVIEVVNFCRSLKAGVDAADFRQVKFALTIWSSCTGDEWKRWVRMHFRRI